MHRLKVIAKEMLDRGVEVEEVLQALRDESNSIIQSIKVMRDVMHISLADAKTLVHYSRAWSDMRDPHAELHERAEIALGENRAVLQSDGTFSVKIDLDDKK